MRYLLFYCILILLLLPACTQQKGPDAMVDGADQTDVEKNMLEMLTENAFVYDVKVNDNEAEELRLTIDYYENGEFKAHIADMSSGILSDQKDADEPIRVIFARQMTDENHENWITAVLDNGGYSSSESESREVKRENLDTAWGGVNDGELTKGEEQIIGMMIHSENDTIAFSSLIETEEELKEATDYEQAYVLSVQLK
jgi:hypothetical protein